MQAERESRYTYQGYPTRRRRGTWEHVVPVAGAARTEELREFHEGAEQEIGKQRWCEGGGVLGRCG